MVFDGILVFLSSFKCLFEINDDIKLKTSSDGPHKDLEKQFVAKSNKTSVRSSSERSIYHPKTPSKPYTKSHPPLFRHSILFLKFQFSLTIFFAPALMLFSENPILLDSTWFIVYVVIFSEHNLTLMYRIINPIKKSKNVVIIWIFCLPYFSPSCKNVNGPIILKTIFSLFFKYLFW